MTRPPRRAWLYAVLSVFVVAAFLARNINAVQMHPDDLLSYKATDGDLAFTVDYQASVHDNQAPAWFMTFWAWRQLAGSSEFSARVLGLLLTTLMLALLCRLARDWFPSKSPWIEVVIPLVLLGNGFFFTNALDIRPYPLVLLSATLSMAAFQRWMARGSARRAAFYGVTAALLLYVHYLLVFLLFAQDIYFLLAGRFSRRWVAQGALAAVIGAGVWLPWLPAFIRQVVHLQSVQVATGMARGLAGNGVTTQATSWQSAVTLAATASNGLIGLYGLVVIAGLLTLWNNRNYRLALLWAFGAPLLNLAANGVVAVYTPRYLAFAAIGLALAVALGLLSLPLRFRQAGIAAFIVANLLTFGAAIPIRVPYRDIYRLMSARAQPGDAVLFHHGGEGGDFVGWQYAHYLSPELQAAMTTDLAAGQADRVWFVTGDWFSDDTRRVYEQLEAKHTLQLALGQCDRDWCYLALLLEAPGEPARTVGSSTQTVRQGTYN